MALTYEDSPEIAVSKHASGWATVSIWQGSIEAIFTLTPVQFDTWREAFGYEV